MSGLLVVLLYLTCLIIGFCGGIFGYLFVKHIEKKRNENREPETISVKC